MTLKIVLPIAFHEAMELPAAHDAVSSIIKSIQLGKEQRLTTDIHHTYQKEHNRPPHGLKKWLSAASGLKSELHMHVLLAKNGFWVATSTLTL